MLLTPSTATTAHPNDVPRCTEDINASATDYEVYNDATRNAGLQMGGTGLGFPAGSKNWQMLIRSSTIITSPIALFFTKDGSHQVENQIDSDVDGIPDFVERTYNCLIEAFTRYKSYYSLNSNELEHFKWMRLWFDNGAKNGDFYPVFLELTPAQGQVQPWFLREPGSMAMNRPSLTYMTIDPKLTFFPEEPGSGWLYPHLENTIYYEMAHVFQGLYKEILNPFDLKDWWMYEGGAVYVADQALLPQCILASGSANQNPPRIPLAAGRVSLPSANCRKPDINERDSETRISDDFGEVFISPWIGLMNSEDRFSRYSSVLFWYYAQAHLKAEVADPADDVMRSLWKNFHGGESTIDLWAEQKYGRGLGEMYHKYMVANYLNPLSYPVDSKNHDNPYYEPWWPGNAFIKSPPTMTIDSQDQLTGLAVNDFEPLQGDKGISNIEPFGTRYYTIEPDPTVPTTATLEVRFRLDKPLIHSGAYDVTVLDLELDSSTKQPSRVITATNLYSTTSGLFRVPNFSGADRRAVVVVSKVWRGVIPGQEQLFEKAPFTISASFAGNGYDLAASPPVFSPNGDGRSDRTELNYFLPEFPSPDTFNAYRINVIATGPDGVERNVVQSTQQMSQTAVYTWTGTVDGGFIPPDGSYTLSLEAQELPGGFSNGNSLVFTTSVTIDTTPPLQISNLQFEKGSVSPPDLDVLSWDSISDASSGGFEYLVYRSAIPITDTDVLTPSARVASTTLFENFWHYPEKQYFAVVAEDAAGNRSEPTFLNTVVDNADVVLIIDDSGSMSDATLQSGLAGSIELVNQLAPQARLTIQNVENDTPGLPWTTLDPAGRLAATSVISAFNIPGGYTPMEEALERALAEFTNPLVASDGRTHAIIVFTDGDWEVSNAMRTALRDAGVSIYFVLTPGGILAAADSLVTATRGVSPASERFMGTDTIEDFRRVARALQGATGAHTRGVFALGESVSLPFQVNSSTSFVSLRFGWDRTDLQPEVSLTTPDGDTLGASALASGLYVDVQPGVTTFSLDPTLLPRGSWTATLDYSAGGTALSASVASQMAPSSSSTSASVPCPTTQ